MSGFDRARCREAAAECVDLARIATDTNTKQILLDRAQEWLKLAYSDHDAEFTKLLGEFNTRQMDGGAVQRQEAQQQQQRISKPDGE
ncbi:MAG TPA: hypothetical protein VJT13_22360 [Xanthobacteraceae bacterium]|nr:hypothetical protein [Xanthobacteraceae bacterium]